MSESNRVAVLAIAWGCATIITITTMIFAGANFWIILVAILAAAFVTSEVMDTAKQEQKTLAATEKRKRESVNTGSDMNALMNLLDEDDIAELRQRVRDRLLDRIEVGDDGELNTIDALLAEQERRLSNR